MASKSVNHGMMLIKSSSRLRVVLDLTEGEADPSSKVIFGGGMNQKSPIIPLVKSIKKSICLISRGLECLPHHYHIMTWYPQLRTLNWADKTNFSASSAKFSLSLVVLYVFISNINCLSNVSYQVTRPMGSWTASKQACLEIK